MALTPDQVVDFVNLTLPRFQRYKWTDLSMLYPEYVSATLINQKKVVEQGGPSISFRIKTKNTGNARVTGLFGQDITKVEDVTIPASIPWTMQTTNFSFDIYEDLFQSDKETIIKELKIRDHDALSDMAELQETLLWGSPASPSDNKPMGVSFWLQKAASGTAPDGDFTGGNPSGFPAGCAGVDSNAYPRWRNYAFNYKNVTTDDLVRKIKRALAFTNFVAPVPYPEIGYGKSEYYIYTTYRVQEPMERLAESRNDNLGSDVAKYLNAVVVGGTPVKWVPYLEANDTSDPIYGVNWKVIRPFVKKGANMRRNPPKEAARQHTVREVHIDNWSNYACYNRRATFVGSKA
jgi:hypothetical protein